MPKITRDFQIFAKPAGYRCNLSCRYCYYLDKADLFPVEPKPLMTDALLATYIRRHIEAHPGNIVRFLLAWRGTDTPRP